MKKQVFKNLEEELELYFDEEILKIVEERDTKDALFFSHDEAWAES